MKYQVHPDVAWVGDEEWQVHAMRLPDGDPIVLEGPAAMIFLDVVEGHDPVAEALGRWPEDASAVEAGTASFLEDLVQAGVLLRADTAPSPPRRGAEPAASPRTPARMARPAPHGVPVAPYRVLFVCTANICRSAYADVISRQSGIGGVQFSSAGTHALVDQPMDPPMAACLPPGVDPSQHRARQLTRQIAQQADLIIAMSERHREFILDEYPDLARRTFLIGHVAREMARMPSGLRRADLADHLWNHRSQEPADSVRDPYRRGSEVMASCARRIEELLGAILTGFQRTDQGGSHA